MKTSESFSYYLSPKMVTSDMSIFSAVFCESSGIASCYIVASSLRHAIRILYDELSLTRTTDYLDNSLLEIKFVRKFL